MKYLSVCSGIEAATVAWKPLGWEAIGFSEIEPFPCAVLAHHYPETRNYGDLTKHRDWNIDSGSIDVLVGGTPCQSFSVSGLRKGLDDPRGNLALEFLALADRVRPSWIIWENVPGVLSSNEGRDFGAFVGALAKLGYQFVWRVLDAQFFGLAQRRKRVFLVANLRDWRYSAAVLFEPESLRRDSPPSRQTGQGVAGTLASRTTAGGGLGTDLELDGGVIAGTLRTGNGNGGSPITEDLAIVAFSGRERGDDGRGYDRPPQVFGDVVGAIDTVKPHCVAHTLRAEHDASEDGTGHGTPIVAPPLRQSPYCDNASHESGLVVADTTQITSAANRSNPQPGDPCHPLAAGAHAPLAFNIRGREDGAQPELSDLASIRAASGGSSRSYVAESAPRRLTPRECERLQGFPDDYTLIEYRKQLAKDGPRYKALGNSMAVPVMHWLGRRIERFESLDIPHS